MNPFLSSLFSLLSSSLAAWRLGGWSLESLSRVAERPSGRALTMAMVALACVAGAWVAPRIGLGQEAPRPATGIDLLTTAPFDRIILTDGTALDVDPISPRPLPPYDPSKDKSAKARARKKFEPPEEGNIGLPGEKSKVVMPGKEDEPEGPVNQVAIHLLKGEARDFQVKRSNIRRIDYFEDLLLAESDRLALARDFARAFECDLRVQARDPNWKGLTEHVNRLLFEEGSRAMDDGDGERGLRLLRELFTRRPDYPDLADKLAAAYGTRIARAFEIGAFARGRRILHEMEPLAPEHPVLRAARERFIARARELVEEASKHTGSERLDALTDAVRVWPSLEGAGGQYVEAFAAEPTLDVAVTDLARPLGPWVHSPADDRVTRLLYLPILAGDDEESIGGKRPGQLAEALESSDLGRKLKIRLRSGIAWSDGSRPISAIDVARALTDRAEPASPRFNARWADLLDRVEMTDESRVEVRLTRAFLKPAAWLLDPIGPAHAGWDGQVATSDHGRQLVGDGPFRSLSTGARDTQFRATADRRAAGGPRVRRIKEVRLPSVQSAIGSLIRGEVSLVEHVPPDRVSGLTANPEIKVGRFARPSLHRIALDGRSPALRNRAFRRGLSYAIDRKTLLEETVLRRPADAANLVADGPLPRGSYGDAPDVKPLGYDPILAKMLVAAARRELGGKPIKLNLEYPATPEARAVAPKLAESFRLIGVEIVLAERPESALEAELRAGRKFDLAYRASRCDEPALEVGGLLCPAYDAPPSADALSSLTSPRILQLLLQLERAPEWPTAKGLVVQIDRESRDELPVLPLWQIEDHYAWRSRLSGPAEVADRLYQGIESWEVEPWFAKDPW